MVAALLCGGVVLVGFVLPWVLVEYVLHADDPWWRPRSVACHCRPLCKLVPVPDAERDHIWCLNRHPFEIRMLSELYDFAYDYDRVVWCMRACEYRIASATLALCKD